MMGKFTLKELRRAKGFSQNYMAEVCGIHINTYRAWEEKPSEIKLGMAFKIAEKLGVSINDIIFLP